MYEALKFAIYEFDFLALEDTTLGKYHGSMIRGTLGNTLKKTLCRHKEVRVCEQCTFQGQCMYLKLFYGLNTEDSVKNLQAYKLPNPYVINDLSVGIEEFPKNSHLRFQLVIIGKHALENTHYYLYAVKEMEVLGFGVRNQKFRLAKVYDVIGEEEIAVERLLNPMEYRSYQLSDYIRTEEKEQLKDKILMKNLSLKMNMLTPCKIQVQGKYVDKIGFEIVVKNILRRAGLIYEHILQEPFQIDYPNLIGQAKETYILRKQTIWERLERHSTYKNQNMSISGVIGFIQYGDVPQELLETIWLSEIIHIGKATTTGSGWLQWEVKIGQ